MRAILLASATATTLNGLRARSLMEKLRARPEFAKEIAMPPEAVTRLEATRRSQVEAGKTLEAVAGF